MKNWLPFLMLLFILTACSQIAPIAEQTAGPAPEQTLPSATTVASPYPLPAEGAKGYPRPVASGGYPQPVESPTPASYPQPQIAAMATETRFGVPAVDRVLDSLFNNPEQLNTLVVYTKAACTTAEGLGSPPKCAQDQPEGTIIEGLPVLGAEGHFLRKGERRIDEVLGKVDLLGVFKVVEGFQFEEHYPAGQYGVVLRQSGTAAIVVLRLTADGIVRLDYPTQIPGKEQPDLEIYLEPQP